MTTRAKYFGVVSGAAGLGAAAGPLIGGLITSYDQLAGVVPRCRCWSSAGIALLARGSSIPARPAQRPSFDVLGAVLSAVGLFFVVFGILQSGTYGWFTAKQDFRIGDTVVIPAGRDLAGVAVRGDRVVILAPSSPRCGRGSGPAGPAVLGQPVPQPDVEPRPADPEPAVAGPEGSFFVISVYLQQDLGLLRHRRPAWCSYRPRSAILLASAAAQRHGRPALPAAADPGRFRGHGRRLRPAAGVGPGRTHGLWTFVPGLFLDGSGRRQSCSPRR